MKTIVINGANGYVASNFIDSLLKQQYMVIALVRANKQEPEERMNDVLAYLNDDIDVNTINLEVHNYSLLDENFSMNENILKSIFSDSVDYFHFAASLKYDEKSVDEIFSTNIEGVKNSVTVFTKYATPDSRFFYIGTAYSCGKISGVFEENFYKNETISSFRNYYELSKRFAENIIREEIEKTGFNGHVIRLSQVVGNNHTGKTKTDYGIFDFAKRMYNLSRRYPDEIIRARIDPESTQNLIPVDAVVKYLIKTTGHKEVPVIMNFTAKHSVKNSYIIDCLNDLLTFHILPVKELNRSEMNSIERLVAAGMSFTESYIDTDLIFDTKNRDKIIASSDVFEVDEDSVYRMLKYFIRMLYQKRSNLALSM